MSIFEWIVVVELVYIIYCLRRLNWNQYAIGKKIDDCYNQWRRKQENR